MSKKILFLFTSDFPFGNGETFLETEIQYLAKGFEEVKIISTNTKDQKTRNIPANCQVERFDLSMTTWDKFRSLSGCFSSIFWQERKIIRKTYGKRLNIGILKTMLVSLYRSKVVSRKVDHFVKQSGTEARLYFYSYWCDDVALGLAISQKNYPEIRTFCRIHRWDVYFEESEVNYLPYRTFITKNISQIFSISIDGIKHSLDTWKVSESNKFSLSRLGVNNNFQLKSGIHPVFSLVSCSNIIPVKRVHLIAEALKNIEDVQIKWVHIGDGPDRSRLEMLIATLPSNVEVELKGRMPNSEIYKYYDLQRPDLFINVSTSEGVPVSIMEAISFGIPVIATNVGGNSEIVNDTIGSLIKKDITPLELSVEIIRLRSIILSSPEFRQNSYSLWNKEYNAEKNYTDFLSKICSL